MANDNLKSEKDIIQELITKSEEEFEKKITYIGAGALILSLTLLEKLFKLETSSGTFFLILSWSLLIFSLLINLISHLVAKLNLRAAENEIDLSIDSKTRINNYKKRLNQMEWFNWTSAITLVLGILFILVFAAVNTVKHHTQTIVPKNDTIKVEIINQQHLIMTPIKNEQENGKERLNEGFSNPRPQIETEKKGYTNPSPRQDQGQTQPTTEPTKGSEQSE